MWMFHSIRVGLNGKGRVTPQRADGGELFQFLRLGVAVAEENGAGFEVALDHLELAVASSAEMCR